MAKLTPMQTWKTRAGKVLIAGTEDNDVVYYRIVKADISFECDCGWPVDEGDKMVETYTNEFDDNLYNWTYCSKSCALGDR